MQHLTSHLRTRTAAGFLCCAAMVTGCTSTSEETVNATYTIEQARQDPIEVVTETTELLAAEGWSSKAGGPWPGECSLGGGEDGAYYAYTVYSDDRSEDLHADVYVVAEHWESLGMDVNIVEEGVVSPRVYATGGPVRKASFNTNDPGSGRYRVGATSWCAPGNALELGLEENERRAQREVIPGDDYFRNNPESEADETD
ncbi:MAG TPA: hypothetical protein VIG67_04610 [Yaniella sp.]